MNDTALDRHAALDRLDKMPRRPLANLPTPLQRATRLASALAAPELDLWIKMDAETGFALGGNKVRKLEYELAAERIAGVDVLLTAGGPQSNHCRVTAAAAARLGLRCILVVTGPEATAPRGNALLHRLFGAEMHIVADRSLRTPTMEALAQTITEQGGHPRVVPIGASTGLGCLGYARAAVELTAQMDALGPPPPRTVVFVPSSSCGTLAGLALGMALLGRDDVLLVGVSADADASELAENSLTIAHDGAALLGWGGRADSTNVVADDSQVGGGYGIPTEASTAAIALLGRTEGIVLDPTYTAKGVAGLVAWAGDGRLRPDDRVVFLHTGGHPGLLA